MHRGLVGEGRGEDQAQPDQGGREPFLQPVPPYPGTDPLELPRHALEIIDRRSHRSEEHTSELQSLMRISYAVFCLKKKKITKPKNKSIPPINRYPTRNTHPRTIYDTESSNTSNSPS